MESPGLEPESLAVTEAQLLSIDLDGGLVPELHPMLERRARFIEDLAKLAQASPTPELRTELLRSLEAGTELEYRLARLRGRLGGELHRLKQFACTG